MRRVDASRKKFARTGRVQDLYETQVKPYEMCVYEHSQLDRDLVHMFQDEHYVDLIVDHARNGMMGSNG